MSWAFGIAWESSMGAKVLFIVSIFMYLITCSLNKWELLPPFCDFFFVFCFKKDQSHSQSLSLAKVQEHCVRITASELLAREGGGKGSMPPPLQK